MKFCFSCLFSCAVLAHSRSLRTYNQPCYQQSTGKSVAHGTSVISGHASTLGQTCTCSNGGFRCHKTYTSNGSSDCSDLQQGDTAQCLSPTNRWRRCEVVRVLPTLCSLCPTCGCEPSGFKMHYVGFGGQHNEEFDMDAVRTRMRCAATTTHPGNGVDQKCHPVCSNGRDAACMHKCAQCVSRTGNVCGVDDNDDGFAVCPADCETWFDGCNTCSCAAPGTLGVCTQKYCYTKGASKCLQTKIGYPGNPKPQPRPCYQQSTGKTVSHGQSVVSGHSLTYGQTCKCYDSKWRCFKTPTPAPTPYHNPNQGCKWQVTHSDTFCDGSWRRDRKRLAPTAYGGVRKRRTVNSWQECQALVDADGDCGDVAYFSPRKGECRCVRKGRRCKTRSTYGTGHSVYGKVCCPAVVTFCPNGSIRPQDPSDCSLLPCPTSPPLPRPTPFPTPAPTPSNGKQQDCYSEPNRRGHRYLVARAGETVTNCAGRSCTCDASTGSLDCKRRATHCGGNGNGEVVVARKEYGMLTDEEKQVYADALLWVHDSCRAGGSGPGSGGSNSKCGRRTDGTQWTFHAFLRDHELHEAHGHGQSKFLPWHRRYLRELEERLQGFHACAAIPYWDWTLDSGSEFAAHVYDRFLGDHTRARLGRFSPGGARPYTLPPSWGSFSRRGGGSTGPTSTFADQSRVRTLLAERSYSGFRENLESSTAHVAPHFFVGGHMGAMHSPADPFFWMHHAQVDKIWRDWQSRSSANLHGYDGNTGARLSPQWGSRVRVRDALAPNACYIEPSFTTVLPIRVGTNSALASQLGSSGQRKGQAQSAVKGSVASVLGVSPSRVSLQRQGGGNSRSNRRLGPSRRLQGTHYTMLLLVAAETEQQAQSLAARVRNDLEGVSNAIRTRLDTHSEDDLTLIDSARDGVRTVAFSRRPMEKTSLPLRRSDLVTANNELTAFGKTLQLFVGLRAPEAPKNTPADGPTIIIPDGSISVEEFLQLDKKLSGPQSVPQ